MITKFNLLKKNININNYYYYSKYFTNEEIEDIIELSKKYTTTDGMVFGVNNDGNVYGEINFNYRKSKITWIPYNDESKDIYEKMIFLLQHANNNCWNFNITNLLDDIQITEYNDNSNDEISGHYDWHTDFSSEMSTRKLSMSIQLSDENDYEGGDLEFMTHRSIIKAPREKGTVIFFPSYITHRVSNVTKGTRKSMVCWFHGPPFV